MQNFWYWMIFGFLFFFAVSVVNWLTSFVDRLVIKPFVCRFRHRSVNKKRCPYYTCKNWRTCPYYDKSEVSNETK